MSSINGTNVSGFQARQQHVEIGHLELSNDSSWQKGASRPFLLTSDTNFKKIKIVYVVKGSGREDIIKNTSNLLAAFREPAILELDGFEHFFRGVMTDHSEDETSMRRWHKVTVTLDGYEYGENITASGEGTVIIDNPGNVASPCIVTLTSSVGLSSATLTGICRDWWTKEDMPVKIGEITKDVPVKLDGLTGKFTEGDKLKEVEIWELPTLEPGQNTITCENTTINVECIPVYM